MTDAVAAYRAGKISAPVAFARLALAGPVAARDLPPDLPEDDELRALVETRTDAAATLRALATGAGLTHADASLADIAAGFDRAAHLAPDAAMAGYTLGDKALAARATAEVVAWLDAENLLGGNVLDLGCGLGRLTEILAPRVRRIVGVDISAGMIALARVRSTHANARYVLADGLNWPLGADRFDLVLAADCLPYAVLSGVADALVARAVARLRPGGALAILNLSYRDDAASDRADARRWAGRHGLALRHAPAPFRLWDAASFILVRSSP